MKELSVEEKAKAYDKAIKEAAIAYKDEDKHLKATLERIFPQLKESEDERIRKELIDFIKGQKKVSSLETSVYQSWLAWLEKQKPDEWSEEDEDNRINAIKYLELFDAQGIHGNVATPCINWLKSLKDKYLPQQKQEWSEEDKGTLERIISFINSFVDKDLGEVVLNEEIFTDDVQQELKRYVDFLRNIESIFPELKESGDERIRKELIAHCENLSEMFHIIDKKEDFVKYQSWIAWLEKQGKQKPTENSNKHSDWNEEDEKMFRYALDMIEWYSGKNEDKSRLVSDWLKSIKPQKQF